MNEAEYLMKNYGDRGVSYMLLITIETLRYESDCLKKAREALLIHKDKTIGPLGIKKRKELYSLCNPYHVHL